MRTLTTTMAMMMILVACSGERAGAIASNNTGAPSDAGAALDGTTALFPPSAASAGTAVDAGVAGAGGPLNPSPVTPAPSGPVVAGCTFDTFTSFPFQGKTIESITAHGKLFNYETGGNAWATNGMDLAQVSYFASGPCGGQGTGQCAFDTRAFAMFSGNHLVEFITANGRSWAWDNGQVTDRGSDLATARRYSEICALRGQSGPCTFDTRAFVNVGNQLIESITAYGKYFAFDLQGNRMNESGADLTAVPRYAAGPCKGRTAGSCKLDSRAYVAAGDRTVEVVIANGYVWRYLTEAGGFAEVDQSGVPVSTVTAWAGACQ